MIAQYKELFSKRKMSWKGIYKYPLAREQKRFQSNRNKYSGKWKTNGECSDMFKRSYTSDRHLCICSVGIYETFMSPRKTMNMDNFRNDGDDTAVSTRMTKQRACSFLARLAQKWKTIYSFIIHNYVNYTSQVERWCMKIVKISIVFVETLLKKVILSNIKRYVTVEV